MFIRSFIHLCAYGPVESFSFLLTWYVITHSPDWPWRAFLFPASNNFWALAPFEPKKMFPFHHILSIPRPVFIRSHWPWLLLKGRLFRSLHLALSLWHSPPITPLPLTFTTHFPSPCHLWACSVDLSCMLLSGVGPFHDTNTMFFWSLLGWLPPFPGFDNNSYAANSQAAIFHSSLSTIYSWILNC